MASRRREKGKEQEILIGVFFPAVTIDTTNKGSRPEIHARVGEELVKLSDLRAPS
jgi:hypothetical protein